MAITAAMVKELREMTDGLMGDVSALKGSGDMYGAKMSLKGWRMPVGASAKQPERRKQMTSFLPDRWQKLQKNACYIKKF